MGPSIIRRGHFDKEMGCRRDGDGWNNIRYMGIFQNDEVGMGDGDGGKKREMGKRECLETMAMERATDQLPF